MEAIFKKIGQYIWQFLNSRIIFIILAVVLGFFFMRSCNGSKEEQRKREIVEQNLAAATDSIEIIKAKNGELNASKDSYILTEKELKEQNSYLYEKIKKQEGDLISVNRTVFKLTQDNKYLNDRVRDLEKILGDAEKINDSTWAMNWSFKYNYDSLNYDYVKGQTTVGVSLLDKDFTVKHLDTRLLARESQIELTFGQRVVDDKLNIFLQTNYPGFSPSVMEGTLIDPNTNPYIKSLMKKSQFLPNTWNVGLGTTVGYDFLHNQPAIVVGVNLTYSLYKW